MAPLTEFPLFTQLPLDIRFLIWHLLMPTDRVLLLKEKVSYPTTDSLDIIYHTDSDESQENRVLAAEHGFVPISLQTYRGQTQLEQFGFTSPKSAPSLPTDEQIREEGKRQWEQLRKGKLYTPDPIPILVHICRESRALAQAHGYALAFSTRTAPAMTWFNYRKDILYLEPLFIEDRPPHHDYNYPDRLGSGSLSQLQATDLTRVLRLAVPTDDQHFLFKGTNSFAYGKALPSCLHDVAKRFSQVKELCVVLAYTYNDDVRNYIHPQPRRDGSYTYWPDASGDKADRVVLDLKIEERLGHYVGWQPDECPHNFHPMLWYEDENTPRTIENLAQATEAISKHYPCKLPPKPRLVTMLPRTGAENAAESRLRFRQFIHKLFRDRVEEERTGREIAFRFQPRSYDYHESRPDPRIINLEWVTNAANALSLNEEDPVLFTEEWVKSHLKQKEANPFYQERYRPRSWD